MKTNRFPFIILLAIGFIPLACSEDSDDDANSSGQSTINIGLTDAPASYDSVLIDIQSIELTTDQGKHTAQVLNPGVYNLLDYANGLDTLLITEDVPSGRLNQIRLILGNDNRVVVDGQSNPLNTPSAQQSGLKLNVQENLTPGAEYTFTLDFDAQRSIVARGNGAYNLKPVIRVITEAISGAIEGQVNPADAAFYSFVVNGTDTLGTQPDSSGYFKITGVPGGNYDLQLMANPNYSDTTLTGLSLSNGQLLDVGTVNF